MEKKIHLTIKGTHCQACKRLIERKFGNVGGVISVDVNFETGATEVVATKDITKEELREALEGMEYIIV